MEDVGLGMVDGRRWFCHTEALDTDGPWFDGRVWRGRTLVKLLFGPKDELAVNAEGIEYPASRSAYVCVEVFGDHLGVHGRPWCADCFLELSDRRQWVARSVHETREAASEEASAFTFAALELLRRDLRGEEVLTPGQKRETEALKAWDDSMFGMEFEHRVQHAQCCYDAPAARGGWPFDKSDAKTTERILRERLREKKHERDEQKRNFVQRYHELRSWREFA